MTIEILKQAGKPVAIKYIGKCLDCHAVVQCDPEDRVIVSGDFRDKPYHRINCPNEHCPGTIRMETEKL